MSQAKYASDIPKNLGLGFNFRPISEGDFLTSNQVFVVRAQEHDRSNFEHQNKTGGKKYPK